MHGFCTISYVQTGKAFDLQFADANKVTFPNGVFSGTIISSVVKDKSIKKTAEWQLLLGSIALPGVFLGAWLCDRLGRKQTMMLGFSGYRGLHPTIYLTELTYIQWSSASSLAAPTTK